MRNFLTFEIVKFVNFTKDRPKFGRFSGRFEAPKPRVLPFLAIFRLFSGFWPTQNCRLSWSFWTPEIWEIRGLGGWRPFRFCEKSEKSVKNEVSKSEPNFCLWQKFGEVRTNFCPDFYKILSNFHYKKFDKIL